MKPGPAGSFGARLKALREAAGYTQEELATIAGLSVQGVSALERGERQRPHVDTVRALCAAFDLTGTARDALVLSARAPADNTSADELGAGSLPLPLTTLVGREADVQMLQDWLANPAIRLITITGPGGVGKTRLALEIAHAHAAERAARVVFVPLAATRTPLFVASAIAEALGLSSVTAMDLPKRARAACEGRRTLLVLDNFEHVLEAAPLVADLLTSSASLRVLATSRAALRVRGEREYLVKALAIDVESDAMTIADRARCPAVRLFVERVRGVQPDFRFTAANGSTVAAICRRLDGLPLAIELAAPWMKVLTAEQLLRRLGRDALHSTVGPRDVPDRHQTMNATVAWSYGLLDPAEQRAFRHFGALPGLFPIDAAAAVLAGPEGTASEIDALRAAAALIDKSLLMRAPTSAVPTCPVYHMLETVRAYAARELADAGERDGALEGLVRYCRREASLAASGLVGPAQVEWLDRVREDLESYRSAVAWLIEHQRASEAIEIVWALVFFWVIRGHSVEGLRWYEQTLNLPSLPPAAESRALLGSAMMRYTQGEHKRAHTELTRALALARGAGDTEMIAQADHLCGHVEYAFGNIDAARDRFARSVDVFRTLTIPWGTGYAMVGMAEAALASGEDGQAELLLDQAAPLLRDAGSWFLLYGLYVRAVLALRRGDADQAIALVRESLIRIRALHDKFAFVYTLVPLAAAAILKGDAAWAARILGARDATTQRTGITLVDDRVHHLREHAEREARARLGPERWAMAHAAGRTSSIDALLKDIDRLLRSANRRRRGVES
jgi:predicted ATPase/DNA-binding XRE family transcriptional regulator